MSIPESHLNQVLKELGLTFHFLLEPINSLVHFEVTERIVRMIPVRSQAHNQIHSKVGRFMFQTQLITVKDSLHPLSVKALLDNLVPQPRSRDTHCDTGDTSH